REDVDDPPHAERRDEGAAADRRDERGVGPLLAAELALRDGREEREERPREEDEQSAAEDEPPHPGMGLRRVHAIPERREATLLDLALALVRAYDREREDDEREAEHVHVEREGHPPRGHDD